MCDDELLSRDRSAHLGIIGKLLKISLKSCGIRVDAALVIIFVGGETMKGDIRKRCKETVSALKALDRIVQISHIRADSGEICLKGREQSLIKSYE